MEYTPSYVLQMNILHFIKIDIHLNLCSELQIRWQLQSLQCCIWNVLPSCRVFLIHSPLIFLPSSDFNCHKFSHAIELKKSVLARKQTCIIQFGIMNKFSGGFQNFFHYIHGFKPRYFQNLIFIADSVQWAASSKKKHSQHPQNPHTK